MENNNDLLKNKRVATLNWSNWPTAKFLVTRL